MGERTDVRGAGRYAPDPASSCGQLLQRHRLIAGFTQEVLAELSGYSTDYISKLERDQRQPPPIAIDRLAAVLDLSDDDRAELHAVRDRQGASRQQSPDEPLRIVPPLSLPTPLIGRAQERAEVYAALTTSRLVTLTGPGGTGKTRLALQVAAEAECDSRFPDGVAFVDLAPVRDSNLIPYAITGAVGLRDQPGRSPEEHLAETLRRRRLLLVVDNVEHLLDGAPVLGRLLAAAPQVHILATSRVPLHLYGEHEIRVSPLPLPPPIGDRTPADLMASDAVQLFLARAKAANPRLVPAGDDLDAVADICITLDGLPLAIELAAARVNLFSPEALRSRLSERLAILTDGPRDLPHRHRTLRAALDWSYHLLTPEERVLFVRLSAFEGSFDAAGSVAVCLPGAYPDARSTNSSTQVPRDLEDAMVARLGALADQSLVEVTPGLTPRFRLLETIREYAATQLEASGTAESVQARHLAYYLSLAEDASNRLDGPEQHALFQKLAAEHDNLRAALGNALEDDDGGTALRLAAAMGRFWRLQGHLREGLRWLEEALERPVDEKDPAIQAAQAMALALAGVLASRTGDYSRATSFYTGALARYRALGDTQGIARTINSLGNLASRQGEHERATECFDEALRLWNGVGYERGTSVALGNLGRLALRVGDSDRALELLQETLAIKRRLGDTSGTAGTLTSLGRVAIEQGDYSHAIDLLEESLELKDALGNRHGRVTALVHLGWAWFLMGEPERARRLLGESLRIGQEIGARDRVADALENLAAIAASEGRDRDAAWLAAAAAALRAELGEPLSREYHARHEATEATVRSVLDEHAFAAAWASGEAQPLHEVIALLLDELPLS